MRFLFLRAWPALIPLALYVLWLLWRRRKAKQNGQALPAFISKEFLLACTLSVAILAGCLFYYVLSAESNAGASYAPKQFKDGQLIQEVLK